MFAYWRQLCAEEDKIFWVLQGKTAGRLLFQILMCTTDEADLQLLYLIQLQADHSLGRRKVYFAFHLICCSPSPETHLSGRRPVCSLHMKTLAAPSAHCSTGFVCRMALPQTPQLHEGRSQRQWVHRATLPSATPPSLTTPRPEPKETFSRLRGAHILHLQRIFQATSERYVSHWLCLLHQVQKGTDRKENILLLERCRYIKVSEDI